MNETRERKIFTFVMAMSRAQADELDVWAFNHRIHSRAEAIRHLCRIGMAADSAVRAENERLREAGNRRGIYVASKTRHAPIWKHYRDAGFPINSTWIDEAGPGEVADLADLWQRCIREASTAKVLVVYREDTDVLKGGWIEVGAALASGVPVFAVGLQGFTIASDTRLTHFKALDEAMRAALAQEGE